MKLELPPGWTATPAEQPVKFTRQDESQTVRFQVRPAPNTAPASSRSRAVAIGERQDVRSRLSR